MTITVYVLLLPSSCILLKHILQLSQLLYQATCFGVTRDLRIGKEVSQMNELDPIVFHSLFCGGREQWRCEQIVEYGDSCLGL